MAVDEYEEEEDIGSTSGNSFMNDSDDNEHSTGQDEEIHHEQPLTNEETERLIDESKAAEAQEALEDVSLAKEDVEVREELAQSLKGDAEQLDRSQVSGDVNESIADADNYLDSHRPLRRHHGKLLEEGASGSLGKNLAPAGDDDEDWASFNDSCSSTNIVHRNSPKHASTRGPKVTNTLVSNTQMTSSDEECGFDIKDDEFEIEKPRRLVAKEKRKRTSSSSNLKENKFNLLKDELEKFITIAGQFNELAEEKLQLKKEKRMIVLKEMYYVSL